MNARTAGPDSDETLGDEDLAACVAIAVEKDDRARLNLLIQFWRDSDRAERMPRPIAYLHLGLLSGMCDRLLSAQEKPSAVSWGDTREKSE